MSDKRIAILATGNEIVVGDVLNTNATNIALQLTQAGLCPGVQMVVSDEQLEIERAIHFLKESHHAVITVGGLGPTSDDRTRFAVAAALDRELFFDEACWQRLIARFTQIGIDIPDTNRQQCLFPQGSTIINNPNGSAASCEVSEDNTVYFLLPGPPKECLPLIEEAIIPRLQQLDFATEVYRLSWLLLGLGEGSAAQALDGLLQDMPKVELGYRVCYPYLEIKLQSNNCDALEQAKQKVLPYISDYVVSESGVTAAEQLRHLIATQSLSLSIDDRATHGRLQATLSTPATLPLLAFAESGQKDSHIVVAGFDEYWQSQPVGTETTLTLDGAIRGKQLRLQNTVSLRGERSFHGMIEWVCWQLVLQVRESLL